MRAEAEADEVRLPLSCRGIKEYLTLFWDSFASSPFSPATSTAFFSVAQDPSLLQAEHPGYGKCKQIKVAILLNNGQK